MSSRLHHVQLREDSPSSSSSSSDAENEEPSSRISVDYNNNMSFHRRRMASQSTPTLVNQFDGAGHSTQAGRGVNRMRSRSDRGGHGAVASHFLAQPQEHQTWMDFLRDSGEEHDASTLAPPVVPNFNLPRPPSQTHLNSPLPPIPTHASNSRFNLPARPPRSSEASSISSSRASERKRRLTTPESPVRRPSGIRMAHSGSIPGGSSSDPILLSSSPVPGRPPMPPQFPSHTSAGSAGTGRRESDIVLPPWQPDAEVTSCPVCGSQFTFFHRKHHCRKCGRVVCSGCSPHRITIPRQFIVHPPNDPASGANMIDLTSDDESNAMSAFGPFRNPALGGGEEVRVCNPCVPDPNYSPPPQYSPAPNRPFPSYYATTGAGRPPQAGGPPLPPPRGHRGSQSVSSGSQTVGRDQMHRSRDVFNDRRVSYHDRSRVADLWPPTHPPPPGHVHEPPSYTSTGFAPPQPHPGVLPGGRRRFMEPREVQQPAPRRQIAEEDECPVCLRELPPKGPDGNEDARTEHINECIAQHSASPPPPTSTTNPSATSTSLPSQRTRGMSNPAGALGNGEGSSHRVSLSQLTMFPYVATEKDCVDEDGRTAECVICLEDFEAGDKMSRLACWCKFHEKCIRDWWDKKGRGACPTHQLHD
ncbi:FYVE zinc finger-domain-containing protein [Lophiotrema nucula]|uniref:FYVE zinc finger-domain-containing protein n=1 Tax=Lophiotrema nucula TaxID=690887 RepID=A0A6A5YVH8_9PLEO|nr:FYVE zinc finger-domain-containing protein [Lophiotrema nucula]